MPDERYSYIPPAIAMVKDPEGYWIAYKELAKARAEVERQANLIQRIICEVDPHRYGAGSYISLKFVAAMCKEHISLAYKPKEAPGA